MPYNSDMYVTVEGEFKTSTKDAVLIAQNDRDIWIPRKCLSWSSDNKIKDLDRGDECELYVREWFANKNDLEYST